MEGPTVARGEQLWQPYMVRGTIGDAVFGPAGPLAARTAYSVTVHLQACARPKEIEVGRHQGNHVVVLFPERLAS